MSEPKRILVTGATGKQGRSVIEALLSKNDGVSSPAFHIVALVRNSTSSSAQKLSGLPNVSVVVGDLNEAAAIFAQPEALSTWGVFSVQINSDAEVSQGKAIIDAAQAHGVKHFVYSSGDRGGPEKNISNPTKVKNFAAKFSIEKQLEKVALSHQEKMTYTILRPVTFFENQTNDTQGKGFMRMFMQMQNGDKKLQMISTRDIGFFAAESFANPGAAEYRNQAISLAGDEISAREAEQIFREITKKDLPMAPSLVGKGLKFFLRDTVGDMFEWFEKEGYGADIMACRKANPAMLDYRTWLQKYSAFA